MLKTSTVRAGNAPRSPLQRSRTSNQAGRLPGVDGRSERARRFRDVVADLRQDLGHPVKAGEAALVAQVATLVLQREALTATLVMGGKIDSKELVLITGTISRSLSALGLHNRTRRRKLDQFASDPAENHQDPPQLTKAELVAGYQRLRKCAERNPTHQDIQARFKRANELLMIAFNRMNREKSSSTAAKAAAHGSA